MEQAAERWRTQYAPGHAYVDLHAAFSDGRGQLRRELSNDRLHLLGAGYALWRERIAALLPEH